jgi:hypothetical protein
MAATLGGGALPLQATSTAMRRIARERGPITRRVAAQGVARSATPIWLVALNHMSAIDWLTPSLPDLGTFGAIRARISNPTSLSMFSEVTAERLGTGTPVGRPFFRIVPEGQPADMSAAGLRIRAPDNSTAANFRGAAKAHLERVNPGRLGVIFAMAPPFAMVEVRDAIVERVAPERTLVELARAIIATSNSATTATVTAPTSESEVPIEPIMAAPKFPQPMYAPLRDLSQQLLLPGLETVEPNSVLGLETNPRFVEAYLVGLNHEMGRELLWRGFPTDQRGTCFDQFWDTRAAAPADDGDDTVRRRPHGLGDIFAIHQWGGRRLGDPEGAPAGERFVMLIRSSLLRRYPTAVIYAVKAVKPGARRLLSPDPTAELYPAFRGSMDPDVSFFGFSITADQAVGSGDDQGYFIVIQEQPGEPRFGVDVDTPLGGVSHLKVSSGVPSGIELNGMTWGQNGAHMAGILRQQPVRVAIHASQFLRPKPAQPEEPD